MFLVLVFDFGLGFELRLFFEFDFWNLLNVDLIELDSFLWDLLMEKMKFGNVFIDDNDDIIFEILMCSLVVVLEIVDESDLVNIILVLIGSWMILRVFLFNVGLMLKINEGISYYLLSEVEEEDGWKIVMKKFKKIFDLFLFNVVSFGGNGVVDENDEIWFFVFFREEESLVLLEEFFCYFCMEFLLGINLLVWINKMLLMRKK